MWRALLLCLLVFTTPVLAQDDDPGFLARLLQDGLSGAGREVRIAGFEGALSSRATIREMTIADGDGVWLILRGAAMSWNRSALLRGRIEVAELSADEIIVARLPVAETAPGIPDPAATAFRLPELPVSVEIGGVRVARAVLEAPVLGEEVIAALEGALRLDGGEGDVRFDLVRTNASGGAVELAGTFDNTSGILSLNSSVTEPEGGLVATLIGLPGAPALDLAVKGEGPLSEFRAEIALASDGVNRLEGAIETGTEILPDGTIDRTFSLDVGGDVTPLFLPEFREFFGPDVSLEAEGRRLADGRTELSRLRLASASANLSGTLALAADGLPEAFELEGQLANPDGGPVRLPAVGEPVNVDEIDLAIGFDATRGEVWTGDFRLVGLATAGLSIAEANVLLRGEIGRSPESGRRISATVQASAEGVAPTDRALAEALGEAISFRSAILWREGQPLTLSNAELRTAATRFAMTGTLGTVADGAPLRFRASADFARLDPYSTLAGLRLGGRLVLSLNGEATLLDGRFDLRAGGAGRDLSAGMESLDALIGGESRLAADVRRDETGITIRRFEITTSEARIDIAGLLRPGDTGVEASARIEDAGRIVSGLSGSAFVRATARETAPGAYDLSVGAEGPGGTSLGFTGALLDSGAGALTADGRLTARVEQLGAWSPVAGRRLSGQAALTVNGRASFSEEDYALSLDLSGDDLSTGIPEVDRLIGRRAQVSAAFTQQGDTAEIQRFTVETPEVTASASGRIGRTTGDITARAQLRSLALYAPDFPGPVTAQGRLGRREDGRFTLDLTTGGPGGTEARISGDISETGDDADLRLAGELPLGIANASIAPRAVQGRARFDLDLDGPLALGSLSGRIRTAGARLVAPGLGFGVGDIGGEVTIAGGSARIGVTGVVDGGGRIEVNGPVGLAAPNSAALRITLDRIRFTEPRLLATELSGSIGVEGPLQGGASVTGTIDLGRTEIQIASLGGAATDAVPGLIHLNEPSPVRATRARAGLLQARGGAGSRDGSGSASAFPLDLVIRAPGQIFVRGRGLDAELGGRLLLGGTTASIVPGGQFELIRGRLDILGRRLTMTEGLARLEGEFDPFLRLVATAEADEVTVRVVLEGLASALDIRFESSPDLPEDEVLARLFFGRGIGQISPLQAAQLASAISTLAGGGGGVVNSLRENFGLDDLDITTDADGNAAVRAGRYISENVYTDVTVGADGKAEINLNLDVSRSVTVKGRVGSDGNTGVGVFYERNY